MLLSINNALTKIYNKIIKILSIVIIFLTFVFAVNSVSKILAIKLVNLYVQNKQIQIATVIQDETLEIKIHNQLKILQQKIDMKFYDLFQHKFKKFDIIITDNENYRDIYLKNIKASNKANDIIDKNKNEIKIFTIVENFGNAGNFITLRHNNKKIFIIINQLFENNIQMESFLILLINQLSEFN
jgi:hypothetical protein